MATWEGYEVHSMRDVNWETISVTRQLCDIKFIVIHNVDGIGQKALDIKNWWESPGGRTGDMTPSEMGHYKAFTQFIVGEDKVVMCTPQPNSFAPHVGGTYNNLPFPRGVTELGLSTSLFPRSISGVSRANLYCIGIEHVHNYEKDENVYGKFSTNVLRKSHQLVRKLLEIYPQATVCRHYDITGKPCPVWFAPVYTTNIRTPKGEIVAPTDWSDPANPVIWYNNGRADSDDMKLIKKERWKKLRAYYLKGDNNAVPEFIQ